MIKPCPLTSWNCAASVLLLSVNNLFATGPLLPPGPPAPTFKSLREGEPRPPISALPFALRAPGSYYLTTNLLGATGQHGIISLWSNFSF